MAGTCTALTLCSVRLELEKSGTWNLCQSIMLEICYLGGHIMLEICYLGGHNVRDMLPRRTNVRDMLPRRT